MSETKITTDNEMLDWLQESGRRLIGLCFINENPLVEGWNKKRWDQVMPWDHESCWKSLTEPNCYYLVVEDEEYTLEITDNLF